MKVLHNLFPAAAAFLVASAAGPTLAQEPFDWTGFYAGVHAGYGWGTDDVVTTLRDSAGNAYKPSATNSFPVGGALAGVQLGGNYQMNSFVLGLEGDVSWSGVSGQFQFDTTRPEAIAGGSLDYLATVRGKAGFAFDRTLLYATAGVATAGTTGFANNVWSAAPADDHATGGGPLVGYVIGAGAEQAVSDTISLRAEYLHYGFSAGDFDMTSSAYPAGTVLQTQPALSLGTIQVGLNFHF